MESLTVYKEEKSPCSIENKPLVNACTISEGEVLENSAEKECVTENLTQNQNEENVYDNLTNPLSLLPFASTDDVASVFLDSSQDAVNVDELKRKWKRKRKLSKRRKRGRKFAADDDDVGDDNASGLKKKKSHAPNHFIAIRIDNPEVLAELKAVQDHAVSVDERLKLARVKTDKLHLTLSILRIDDDEALDKVMAVMDETGEEVRTNHWFTDHSMVVSDIGHFGKKVVFADIEHSPCLQSVVRMIEVLRDRFNSAGILPTDDSPFRPHITLMKMSRSARKLKKKGLKSINPDLFSEFSKKQFGRQDIRRLELCDMFKSDGGYYKVKHFVDVTQCTHGVDVSQCTHCVDVSQCTHRVDMSQCTHGVDVSHCTHGVDVSQCTHCVDVSQCTHGVDVSQCTHGVDVSQCTQCEEMSQSKDSVDVSQCALNVDVSQCTHGVDVSQCIHSVDVLQDTRSVDESQCIHSMDESQCTQCMDELQCTHSMDELHCTHSMDESQSTHSVDTLRCTQNVDASRCKQEVDVSQSNHSVDVSQLINEEKETECDAATDG